MEGCFFFMSKVEKKNLVFVSQRLEILVKLCKVSRQCNELSTFERYSKEVSQLKMSSDSDS